MGIKLGNVISRQQEEKEFQKKVAQNYINDNYISVGSIKIPKTQAQTKTTDYNSKESYNNRIAELRKKQIELNNSLISYDKQNASTDNYYPNYAINKNANKSKIPSSEYLPFEQKIMPTNSTKTKTNDSERNKILEEYNNNKKELEKLEKEKKEKYPEWYQKIFQTPKAFKDGYQFGDVSKTITGSVADVGLNLAEGVARVGEGAAKTIAGVGAEIIDWAGNKKYADRVRNNIATVEPVVSGLLNKAQKKIDKYSIFGDTGDEIASSVGYTAGLAVGSEALGSAANIPVGKLNMPTLAVVSGTGSGFEEAYKQGATGVEAWTKALGSGAIEGVTEGLFGMFGVGGNEITDQWGKQAASHFKSGLAKGLAKTGVSATGEAVEELLSYMGNQGLDWLIDKASGDPKFYKKWDWDEVGQEMAIAFISAGLSQGGNTAVNIQHQYSAEVNEEEKRLGRQLSEEEKNAIKEKVVESVINEENNSKDNNNNENVNNNNNNNNNQSVEIANEIQSEIQELTEQRENVTDTQQIAQIDTRINELQQQLNQINNNIRQIQNNAETTQLEANNEQLQDNKLLPINNQTNKVNLPGVKVQENNIKTESANDSFNLKQKQLDIINKSNPMLDDYHTGIRSIGDIMTLPEAYNAAKMEAIDGEWDNYASYPDITNKMLENALQTGEITIYSSYPIENGVFVTPSYQQALDYAGNNPSKVYSKIVPINNVAWINVDEGQYAPIVDLNFTDKAKGNIPINQSLLNKYKNVEEIFNNEKNNYDGVINVKTIDIDVKGKNVTELYHDAVKIFDDNHSTNTFENEGNQIKVTHADIKESINKIFNDRQQNKYLKEHLQVFSDLGDIIENSRLVNQTEENKNRKKYNTWNYYYNGLNINNELYDLEFDVVSRADGENHYRLQRLKKANAQSVLPLNKGESDSGASASYINNTTNLPKNQVVLPINSSMQQNQNNTQEIQGMNVSKSQVEDAVYDKFEEMMDEYGFDVDDIQGVYLHGSRLRGTANQNSDLDAVVFYIGNENEDYIFNTINDDNNQLVIDGVKIDINPVSIDSLSEMDDYITRSEQYDKEVLSKEEKKNNLPLAKDNNVVKANLDEVKNIPKNPTKEESYEVEKKKTRKEIQNELLDEMGITINDLSVGKDISSIGFQRTDPIRLNEKVFGYEVGQKINDATINKTKHNEAERTRFLNQERDSIKELGIKARSKESAAVQKYAEKQYVNDKGEVVKYGDHQLAAEFPNVETQNKIKRAADILRNKYDKYIDDINSAITEMGYDPIPKRTDYMKHFTELSDKLSQWGIPLNRNSLSEDSLPTDINGVTDQFKPGKNWFASAMQRKGIKTTYDAITGIDSYLEGASNLIYHTEDIQRYRALSKLIRETYGQTHGMDNIDVNTKEGQQRLNDIFDNKLSKYVAWLDEQANSLAGKKGAIDRGAERALGRKIYGILETAKKQVGSNMTGFNVRSALTNFASAVQGVSKTNKLAFLKGTASTLQNIIHDDGLINKSDFLTSRFGSDMLSKKLWQKASNAGQIFMTGTDYFTANQIWRGKYYENLQKGMSESEAIKKADDFAARIMGDRSKGSTAEIFNSKTLGLLTQFQLEVNNQWSSIVHDNKMDLKSGNKSGATVVFQLGQLAALSYFFNGFMRAFTGSDVMIDPIDMLKKIIGKDDDDKDKTLEERATEVIGDLWDDLPFVSFLSGGRIPLSEAFKGGDTLLKYATGQTDKYGNKISLENVKKDAIESAYYWLLPTGYGQLRKTTKGLSMYDKNLPIAGSYTDSGNLRFTADESTGGKIKAALFGQYSSEESQKYSASGYKAISSSRVQELKDLGMTASEYRKYNTGLKNAGSTNAEKIDYIVNSDYTDKQKNIMAKNVLKKDFDIKDYKKYSSYDEYDYATKYPDKYSVVSQITSFDNYTKWKNEIQEIKNNTTNDKAETIKYINGLNLSVPQKAMFIKLYYSTYNNYNNQIVEYINNQKLSIDEKKQILEKLKFTIKDGKVYW